MYHTAHTQIILTYQQLLTLLISMLKSKKLINQALLIKFYKTSLIKPYINNIFKQKKPAVC